MSIASIVAGVLDAVNKFAPALDGTPVAAVIDAGKSLVELVKTVKAVANEDDQVKLQATLDELEPRVMAHLERTIKSLG